MGGPTSSCIATSIGFAGVHKYQNEAKCAFDKMEIPFKGPGKDNQPLTSSLLHAAAAALTLGIVVGQFWN